MPKATQFTLCHQNRPGMLAHIARVLGDAKVNILACLTATSWENINITTGYATGRMGLRKTSTSVVRRHYIISHQIPVFILSLALRLSKHTGETPGGDGPNRYDRILNEAEPGRVNTWQEFSPWWNFDGDAGCYLQQNPV